jgi:hypothetical protein
MTPRPGADANARSAVCLPLEAIVDVVLVAGGGGVV